MGEAGKIKRLFWFGTFCFGLLLVMSYKFWQERMAFTDGAYHLFYMLAKQSYAIQNHRFIAGLTQSVVVLGAKLGLPLSVLAKGYSVSFVVQPFIFFALLCLVFKNYRLALGMLLFTLLMQRHSFYWPLSEVIQGMGCFFIYWALVFKKLEDPLHARFSAGRYVLSTAVLLTACFAHPVLVFTFAFVFGFWWLHYPAARKFVAIQGFLCLAIFVGKAILLKTPNDSGASGMLLEGLKRFPDIWDTRANRDFLRWITTDYLPVLLLLLLNLGFYIRQGFYKKALLMLLAFVGFTAVNNISVWFGADQFYVENRYLGLSVFVIVPFIFDVLPKLTNLIVKEAVLALASLVFIWQILQTAKPYTRRVQWNIAFLRDHKNEDKLIIDKNKMPQDVLYMFWGTSYELWLLSTVFEGTTKSFITREQENEFADALSCRVCFQGKWATYFYSDLPPAYFKFADTTNTYKLVQ